MATTSETSADRDLVDVLAADHRKVEQMFAELEKGAGTPEHRREVADVVIAELVRHSVAEEEYLYPTVQETLPDGDSIAEHEVAEHAEAEQVMKRLESLEATDPGFEQLTADLIARIRHHVRDEESNLFPRLRQACSPGQLQRLAGMAEMAKRTAPTRPHPSAPDRPPWNMLLAPGAGLVDRARDALSGRPASPEQLRKPRR